MKRNKLKRLVAAMSIGIVVGSPVPLAHADDTEVYVGTSALRTGLRPNVVFVLDTSGSMSGSVTGTSKDRLEVMKDAFKTLLSRTNNVNVGLMRFTDPGGPILFPAANINGDATLVGLASVNVRVSGSTDDASESRVTGAVTTNSNTLSFVHVEPRSFPAQLGSGADDAVRVVGGTNLYQTNKKEITLSSFDTVTGEVPLAGIRFPNLPIFTKGSKVTKAVLALSMHKKPGAPKAGAADPLRLVVLGQNFGEPIEYPATTSGAIVCDQAGDVLQRWWCGQTTAATVWDIPVTANEGDLATVDVSAVLEELFALPAYAQSGTSGAVSLFLLGIDYAGNREFHTFDKNLASAPTLTFDYQSQSPFPGDSSLTGLRFKNTRIPQGSKIKSAVIEFVPSQDSSVPVLLRVFGEDSSTPATFASTTNNVSTRTKTTASVDWSLTGSDAWTKDSAVQTPDITSVVQELVDRSDWCGGNDMSFLVERFAATGDRSVYSFDGDDGYAPRLRVTYDAATAYPAGGGCTVTSLVSKVSASADDAEQTLSSGNTSITGRIHGTPYEGSNRQTIGFRFKDLGIPRSSRIKSAQIEFRAEDNYSNANSAAWVINGHYSGNSAEFRPQNKDITDRTKTTATVNFTAPGTPVSEDDWLLTPELDSIVQEVVNHADWQAGNAMSFVIDGTGSGEFTVHSFDSNQSNAAVLDVEFQVNLGDLGTTSITPAVTVRDKLNDIVDDLDHKGWTPIVDTLYEAALYYRGDAVKYGLNRGTDSDVKWRTRVSHAGSYVNGRVNRPSGCTDTNQSSSSCNGETIVADGGTPTYVSPVEASCQDSHIVLLTDGDANNNHSQSLIRTMTGDSACATKLSDDSSVVSGEECGVELVKFLHDKDQSTKADGINGITTHTIGFDFSGQFLKDLAKAGGGSYHEAKNAAQLADAFSAIIADISGRTTSFAAPSLSANAFNRLFHRNEVYFSLFKPSSSTAWEGNLKKYAICHDSSGNCTVGEVVDSSTPPQPAIGGSGTIADTARSYWSDSADGPEILQGGAGGELINQSGRRVYGYFGAVDQTTSTYAIDTVPQNASSQVNLSQQKVIDTSASGTNGFGVLDAIESAISGRDAQLQATKDILGYPGQSVSSMSSGEKDDLAEAMNKHINWIAGKDVDDEDGDGNTTENRYAFNDPLHSNPVAVTYGAADRTNPEQTAITKIFVGTNDGGIRAINGASGEEEWVFYPQDMLDLQNSLRANAKGDHAYGVDGSPTIWRNDVDKDGYIEPGDGDFVKLFIGMRRGGRSYFALDVTPANEITSVTSLTSIAPKFMWRIDGAGGEYPRLGQTWSRPFLGNVRYGTAVANQTELKKVLFFAGGYDEQQDSTYSGVGQLGNAIYMADPNTGKRLFYVSSDGLASHGAGSGLTVPGMGFSIPSDLGLMDADRDGAIDRMYVGDQGGQVWRVDITANRTVAQTGVKAVAGRLASLAFDKGVTDLSTLTVADADQRRFFYRPDVMSVRGDLSSSNNPNYDLVLIGSGNRSHPLDTKVDDRVFALRDFDIGLMKDTTDGSAPAGRVANDGIANAKAFGTDNAATVQGKLDTPATAGDLLGNSDRNDLTVAELGTLKSLKGYYMDLTDKGEKMLATSVIIDGKAYFTSYLPEGVISTSACTVAEGSGKLYGINVLTGKELFVPKTLGSGIPSKPVPVFTNATVISDPNDPNYDPNKAHQQSISSELTLLVGGGGGATSFKPDDVSIRRRTYWFEQPVDR